MRYLFLNLLLLFVLFTANAQPPCAGPGRTPEAAQAVCGNLTFKDSGNTCTGQGNLPNPTTSCVPVGTDNSRWYKFHCYQAGTLGFLLKPKNAGDDYDWEAMDITGRLPGAVFNTELRVSLNLSGQTGATGCTAAGTSDVNCEGGPPGSQFNRLIDLQTGHDYLLMANNYSASNDEYTITFSGTAILTQNIPPTITNVGIVGCDPSKLRVTFSEDIVCASITNTASEFGSTIAGQIITGITSDCSLPGANGVPSLIINLQTPMPPGNYLLNADIGTDGDIFKNVCLLDMLPASIPFIVPTITPVTLSSVTYTGCAPNVLNVKLSKPIWCSSISGSEFSVSPGNPLILSVQYSCNGTGQYTDQLQVVFQNPLTYGSYQLLVNDGTDGNTFIDTCGNLMALGTSMPFSIAQTTAPLIQSFDYDNCKRDRLVVNFDKPVACASLTANGSEFSFVPGGPAITGIISDCGTNAYTSQVTLLISTPMPPLQSINIMIKNGTDGNTLSDTCYSFITQFYTRAFQAPPAPPLPVVDSVQYDKCAPSSMKVFYSRPILCNNISPDGSQFRFFPPIIPGPVSMVSATGDPATCPQGYTNWILVQFSGPITTSAFYPLMHWPGSDGKVIMDTCNSIFGIYGSGGTIIRLDVIKPSPNFNSQVKWGCVKDTIVLSHAGGISANSWTWNFSDGTSASGQNVSHTFPVTTPTATVQLIVSNGTCIDSLTKTFVLGNFFKAGFSNDPVDSFCINTPVIFTDTSKGNISNYLWDFGDLSQFNGQNPPPHVYPVSKNYTIKLVVTDIYGCTDTASANRYVTPAAFIDFTGLKPQYCTGNPVVLTRKISRYMQSYVWDNGDGKTFTNDVDVNFSYASQGAYTITLSGVDRYCGTATVSKTVPVYLVPVIKLPADTVLCQNDQMLIGVVPTAGYTYLWSTGESVPQILTNIFTRDYTLTADNNGCKGYDAMHVKVLTACVIKMPGAFTPNRDGLNDLLMATNADMAKDFSLKIFNRSGQLVFSTNNPLEGWDGRFKGNPQESGTYVWMLSYIDPWNGKAVKEKGTSILLR